METESEAETKALLAALGMEEYFIECLSSEDLHMYANSQQITCVISCVKTDAQGSSYYVGGATPGIGFGTSTQNKRRSVELDGAIHYVPDE